MVDNNDADFFTNLVEGLADRAISEPGQGILIPSGGFSLAMRYLEDTDQLDDFVASLSDNESLICAITNEIGAKLGADKGLEVRLSQ